MSEMWDYTVSWSDVAPLLVLNIGLLGVAIYILLR